MKQKEETLPKDPKDPTAAPPPEQAEPEFLGQYRTCYPGVKRFHVTGDGMVFLDRDYQQALTHQQGCGRGDLITYNS